MSPDPDDDGVPVSRTTTVLLLTIFVVAFLILIGVIFANCYTVGMHLTDPAPEPTPGFLLQYLVTPHTGPPMKEL